MRTPSRGGHYDPHREPRGGQKVPPGGVRKSARGGHRDPTKTLKSLKNAPPGSAYGRPASLREHERLAEWIVSWAYLFDETLEGWRR